jgi:hypothetical protein
MHSSSSPLTAPEQPSIQYIIFDKKTGRILQRHSCFDVEKQAHVAVPHDELKAMFGKDALLASRATDRDLKNIDFLEVKRGSEALSLTGAFTVDVEKRQLVPLPTLTVGADKPELTGDGKDKAVLEIQAVDRDGKLIRTAEGKIKVTTTRGKLSEPGGVVQLVRGRAKIELTSAHETVSRVKVTARSLDGAFTAGQVTLEFL